MTHSPHWSTASVSCRIEWRPSCWVIGALLSGGVLAWVSVFLSGMPRPAACLLAAAVSIHALWLADRELRRPARSLVFPGNDLPVMVDGMPVEQVQVQWRGSLAFVSWEARDGRRLRLSWWPDTLPPPRRRELRLAAGNLEAAQDRRTMAP